MNPKEDLELQWRNHQPVRLSKIANLAQFDVGETKLSRCDTIMHNGKNCFLYV